MRLILTPLLSTWDILNADAYSIFACIHHTQSRRHGENADKHATSDGDEIFQLCGHYCALERRHDRIAHQWSRNIKHTARWRKHFACRMEDADAYVGFDQASESFDACNGICHEANYNLLSSSMHPLPSAWMDEHIARLPKDTLEEAKEA